MAWSRGWVAGRRLEQRRKRPARGRSVGTPSYRWWKLPNDEVKFKFVTRIRRDHWTARRNMEIPLREVLAIVRRNRNESDARL